MIIRKERESDEQQIWALNSKSYETNTEANLVNGLRNCGCEFLSLVAEVDQRIVGHILFTPIELLDEMYQINDARIMGLVPITVAFEYRLKGIGSELLRVGLEHCRELDYDAVAVLGYASYFPKFGFVPSATYNIKSEYDVPEEVFMIHELIKGSLKGLRGTVHFHDTFNKVA
jgi:putative acetyltransferase